MADSHQPVTRYPCSFAGCPGTGITEELTEHGAAWICKTHYVMRAQDEADDFCQSQWIKTVAEARAWYRKKMVEIGKVRPSLTWARELRDRALAGERLLPIQADKMIEALGPRWRDSTPIREPGSDDE